MTNSHLNQITFTVFRVEMFGAVSSSPDSLYEFRTKEAAVFSLQLKKGL